jgi:nucleoside diphosphate kinase
MDQNGGPNVKHNVTFGMVKSLAVAKHFDRVALCLATQAGMRVVAWGLRTLTLKDVVWMYSTHLEKGYAMQLANSVTDGPVVVFALQKRADATMPAWDRWRMLMGATDASKASKDTVRAKWWQDHKKELEMLHADGDTSNNAVHGSDSAEAAIRELHYFFPDYFA